MRAHGTISGVEMHRDGKTASVTVRHTPPEKPQAGKGDGGEETSAHEGGETGAEEAAENRKPSGRKAGDIMRRAAAKGSKDG